MASIHSSLPTHYLFKPFTILSTIDQQAVVPRELAGADGGLRGSQQRRRVQPRKLDHLVLRQELEGAGGAGKGRGAGCGA